MSLGPFVFVNGAKYVAVSHLKALCSAEEVQAVALDMLRTGARQGRSLAHTLGVIFATYASAAAGEVLPAPDLVEKSIETFSALLRMPAGEALKVFMAMLAAGPTAKSALPDILPFVENGQTRFEGWEEFRGHMAQHSAQWQAALAHAERCGLTEVQRLQFLLYVYVKSAELLGERLRETNRERSAAQL